MFDSSQVIIKNSFKRCIDVSAAAQRLENVYLFVCIGVSVCSHEPEPVCSSLVFK